MAPHPENEAASEEARLLARTGAGDHEAFRLLYRRYSAPLFSLAIRLVGDVGEAEEMLQDSFVKIWRHAASYDPGKSRPFTWTVTIVRRTCIDHLRRRNRLPRTTELPSDAGAPPGFSSDETARRDAVAREESERLESALGEVRPVQRRALELALFSEMTQVEIAQRLEQPVGTVKSWIRRGLLELRTAINDSSP